jgi:hypothetical protein
MLYLAVVDYRVFEDFCEIAKNYFSHQFLRVKMHRLLEKDISMIYYTSLEFFAFEILSLAIALSFFRFGDPALFFDRILTSSIIKK